MISQHIKSIAIHGYHGFQNTGDDLFCYLGAMAANKYWAIDNISFLTPTPIVIPKNLSIHQPIRQFFTGQLLGNMAIVSAVASKIVYMGGSVFHSKPSRFDIKAVHDLLGKIQPSKLAAIGVSIGPFRSEEDYRWIKSFLNKFNYIALRDKRSYRIAKEMGLNGKVVQAFDLAGLLKECISDYHHDLVPNVNRKKYRLGVSICHYERYTQNNNELEIKRENSLLETLKLLAKKHDIEFCFLIFNGDPTYGDRSVTYKFVEYLKPFGKINVCEYDADPISVWHKIRSCNGLLGIRLHSAIMAYMAEIPFALIEYHEKCTEFLDFVGYPKDLRLPKISSKIEETVATLEKSLFSMSFSDLVQLDTNTAYHLAKLNFTSAPWFDSSIP